MLTLLKKSLLSVLILVLVLSLSAGEIFAEPVAGDTTVQLEIYSVNDFHGALAEAGKNPGAAKLAQYLKDCKAVDPQGVLIFSGGDMFQGTPDSNMLYGKTVVAVMNEIGFDAMALGNHEFDWGLDVLKDRIAQARFPFVAANVLEKNSGKPFALTKPYVLLKKQGITIGVIGLATPETTYKSSPRQVGAFTFADPVQTVKRLLPELKAQGADVIIVVSHLGSHFDAEMGEIAGEAAELAKAVTGVNLIISGHEHQWVAGLVNGIPIVQAGFSGRAVSKTTLQYSLAEKRVIGAEVAVVNLPFPGLTADPVVQAMVDQAQAEIGPVKNILLGKTVNDLSHDRSQLSLLGQWSADVMRRAVNADVALQNGGGLRTSIAAGDITVGNFYEVAPFDNTLVTMDLTGEQIKAVLEYGIRNKNIGMVQFSGITVRYDAAQAAGQRVTEILLPSGKPLEQKKMYRVVTNDFMAEGGDGYIMLKAGKNIVDTFMPLRDVFGDAVKKVRVVDFPGDQRLQEQTTDGEKQKTAA